MDFKNIHKYRIILWSNDIPWNFHQTNGKNTHIITGNKNTLVIRHVTETRYYETHVKSLMQILTTLDPVELKN